MKILIDEIHRHRNETTFRPYLQIQDYFREIGIEFVFEGKRWDMAWIGQASYMDKTKSIYDSVKHGLNYLKQFKGQDYILFDGQDSATLMGSYEVFVQSEAKTLLKNTLYADRSNHHIDGRLYWPIEQFDSGYCHYKSELNQVKLSGTNWLSTIYPNWLKYSGAEKDIDVFAMFQYPAKENWEWQIKTSTFYTNHRKRCIEELKLLPSNVKVVTAENGKVPIQEYYNLMSRSKIVIAPFGYGEIAPRDIESAMVGAVLVKPDMSHIETIPNIYNDPKNFIACKWDFSDLNELILNCLDDYKLKQEYYVENLRRSYSIEYSTEKLITHIHTILSEIPGYTAI